MYRIAVGVLVAWWFAWLYPFGKRRFFGPKRESNVMAPVGKWGLLMQTAAMFLAWFHRPGTPEPALAAMIASMILAPAATVFSWMAVNELGKQFRILAGLYDDHELIRTGPYGIVRHPIYLALFLMMIATGLLFARWEVLLLGSALYIGGTEIRIHAEEGLLRSRFGKQFAEYKQSVPAYLPFLR